MNIFSWHLNTICLETIYGLYDYFLMDKGLIMVGAIRVTLLWCALDTLIGFNLLPIQLYLYYLTCSH